MSTWLNATCLSVAMLVGCGSSDDSNAGSGGQSGGQSPLTQCETTVSLAGEYNYSWEGAPSCEGGFFYERDEQSITLLAVLPAESGLQLEVKIFGLAEATAPATLQAGVQISAEKDSRVWELGWTDGDGCTASVTSKVMVDARGYAVADVTCESPLPVGIGVVGSHIEVKRLHVRADFGP